MTTSRKILLAALLVSALGLLCLTPLFAQSRPALPVLWPIPEFHLLNTENTVVSPADFRGKVWVADFIFTTCAGPCPAMTARMAKLQEQFKNQPGVRFVSISVNPEFDTPAVLAEYGKQNGANPDRWTFLTGDSNAIQKVAAEGFKFGTMDEPIMHSTRFALVDRQGRMRGSYIATDDASIRKLPNDIESLLKE
ncbi:MAG: SCO family protein [Candidatus Hydrogenedentes bacterium]|nr:SCO family protein [Candidatus Hydrogenedentota bacterium]